MRRVETEAAVEKPVAPVLTLAVATAVAAKVGAVARAVAEATPRPKAKAVVGPTQVAEEAAVRVETAGVEKVKAVAGSRVAV